MVKAPGILVVLAFSYAFLKSRLPASKIAAFGNSDINPP
jgi:hypothetical protein